MTFHSFPNASPATLDQTLIAYGALYMTKIALASRKCASWPESHQHPSHFPIQWYRFLPTMTPSITPNIVSRRGSITRSSRVRQHLILTFFSHFRTLGLHASISTHICLDYLNQITGEWVISTHLLSAPSPESATITGSEPVVLCRKGSLSPGAAAVYLL